MAAQGQFENVALDDQDPQRRNEALIIENEILKEELEERDGSLDALAHTLDVLRGVQEVGIVEPGEVRKLYTAIEVAIQAFLGPMDRSIRTDSTRKNQIMAALNQPRSFQWFRNIIRGGGEIKAAANDRYTNIIDIWTSLIWRTLDAYVFKDEAVQKFYDGNGQNASYYMKCLNQMDDLMKQANPPIFGRYARRLWRRQGLAAIFRTAKFDWVEQRRAAKINHVSNIILTAFEGFTVSIPRARRPTLARDIVVAAVRLSEHMMIEADDIWTIRMTGFTGDGQGDFYDRIKDFDLTPVGTTAALRDNAPLDTIADRLKMEEVRNRVRPLCTLAPALQFEHIREDGKEYDSYVDLVKPRVLVSLVQSPPAQGAQAPAAAEPDEVIFYTMAQQIAREQ